MKRDDAQPKVVIHNAYNLPWSLEVIKTFPRYGGFRNEWRQRYVDVYQIPTDKVEDRMKACVVSVGTSFDNSTVTIALEHVSAYESRIVNADWSTYK
jgi:hypothetical protein